MILNRKTILAIAVSLLVIGTLAVVLITRRTSVQTPIAPTAPESQPAATSCTMSFTVAATPTPTPSPKCGDGVLDAEEECDAGTNNGKDGYACDAFCKLRKKYACNDTCDRDTQCNEHIVKLVNKVSGTRNSMLIDGITENGVLVPDSSGRFIYLGAWSKVTTPPENQTDGGSYSVTTVNGSAVLFSTTAQSIQLRSFPHPERSIVEVYVDGTLKQTISDLNVGSAWKNVTITVSADASDLYVCTGETARVCRLKTSPSSDSCLPATPTPTPVPQCGTSCVNNADCPSSMVCSSGACRNPSCTGEASCVCPTSTPTPSPTPSPACNSECTSNSQCPSDLICQSNRCRRPGCTAVDSCTCGSPTPTPQTSCGSTCLTNSDCPSSMVCSGSLCRNPSCTDSSTCSCATTPPQVYVPPTETPVEPLPVAGGPLPTIGLVAAGVMTIIVGIIGLLAL